MPAILLMAPPHLFGWWGVSVRCVAYVYEGVFWGLKRGKSSKFRQILATQESLTDFHGKNVFFFSKWQTRKNWDGSNFWWLPWFPDQNNTCLNICNTVYIYLFGPLAESFSNRRKICKPGLCTVAII